MSKLFSDQTPDESPAILKKKSGPILRRRRRRALHPEAIKDLLRERADHRPLEVQKPQQWLLILTTSEAASKKRSDGVWVQNDMKRYCDIRGSYAEAVKQRRDVMESGEYESAWLILKTDDRR